MRNKTPTEPKILECLALHSPANKWQIANLTRKSYANIHEAIRKLKQRNMIKVVKVEASSKNPCINVEYYALTELGLYHAFHNPNSMFKIDEQTLNRIAERYSHVCLTFKKWNSIRDKDVRKFIIDILNRKFSDETLVIDFFSLFRERKYSIDVDAAKKSFQRLDEMVFQIALLAASQKVGVFNKLLLTVKNDEELKTFALEYYQSFENELEQIHKHIIKIKNALST